MCPAWLNRATERSRAILSLRAVHVGLLLAAAILLNAPLLSSRLIEAHDLFFHQQRSLEYLEAIRKGPTLPPLWAENTIGGQGRPYFMYSAPLVQTLGAGLLAVSGDSVKAIQFLAFLLAILAVLGVYLWLQEVQPSHVALLAALSFMITDYAVRETFGRGALAEAAALSFFAWVLWLTERFGRTGRLHLLFLATGAFALVVLSHNLSLAFLGPAIVAYAVLCGWRHQAWARATWGLAIPVGALAITCFYWLPSLLYKDWIDSTPFASGPNDLGNHFLTWGESFGIGFTSLASRGTKRFLTIAWTLPALLGAILLVARPPRHRSLRRFGWVMVVGMACVMFFLSKPSDSVWRAVPMAKYIQFPWRILVLAAFFCAGLSVVFFRRLRWKASHAMALGLVMLPTLLTAYNYTWSSPRVKPQNVLATTRALRGRLDLSFGYQDESAPRCVRRGPAPHVITAQTTFVARGGARIFDVRLGYARRTASYEARHPIQVRFRNAYFPLWSVTANGKPLAVECHGRGEMVFTLPPGSGRLEAVIRPTPLMRKALAVSVAGWLLLFACIFVARWRGWIVGKPPEEPRRDPPDRQLELPFG